MTFSSMCSSSQELGKDGGKVLWPRRGDRERRQEGPRQKPDVLRAFGAGEAPSVGSTAPAGKHSGGAASQWEW